LVENVLDRWDPIFFFDAHTHNGSYHEEPVTWTWGLNPNGDRTLLEFEADTMWPAVDKLMREKYGTLTVPHGDFMDARNPEKGWVPLGPQPRYLSNYVGLRNRLSVLNENYPYADYETRVRGCYNLYLSFLDFLHAERDAIVTLLKDADRKTVERGLNPSERDAFIVEYDREPIEHLFTILGYEMEIQEVEGRPYPRVRPTETKRTYSNVPYYANYTAKRTVRFPRGYMITANDAAIIRNLRRHGITVEQLTEAAKLTVEVFSVTEMTAAERLNQGHYTNTVKGEYAEREMEFPAGTYFVSTAQPLANVAAYLLEPESDDGLIVWNFFDRYLAQQWGRGPREYPVYKLYGQAHLAKKTIRE
jgi:dipeptidyl-peptidase-4